MSYLRQHLTDPNATPQSQPIPGSTQVPNSAGGFAWKVDCWMRMHRFLILGSEGGTYYASEHDVTVKSVDSVKECIAEDGERTVSEIVQVSVTGLAHKQGPTLLALAMCASAQDVATRKAAYAAITRVCRTGTMLFMFLGFVKSQRGWSRGLRTAVANWYERPWQTDREEALRNTAYQVVKYRSREGYSQRDVLRMAHPKPSSAAFNYLYMWVAKILTHGGPWPNDPNFVELWDGLPDIVRGFELIQGAKTAGTAATLVTQYGLPREAVPTEFVSSMEVQAALLASGMPMTALIRNLGNLSKSGLLTVGSEAAKTVVEQLGDEERIKKARVHPIALLAALTTYRSGKSVRGSGEWLPVPSVIDALDAAFYTAFQNVEPTNKRLMLAIDVSSSMFSTYSDVNGIPGLKAGAAAGAMAMVTLAVEDNVMPMAFATDFRPLGLSRRQRLDDVIETIQRMGFGGTDCAIPMLYALGGSKSYRGRNVHVKTAPKPIEIDTFVIYTDSETWAGGTHPAQALQQYRRQVNPDAKLIVVGMASNEFSIADPNDPGMMDVVGFSSDAPSVMSDFIAG